MSAARRPPLVLGASVRVVSRLKAAANLRCLLGRVVGEPEEVGGEVCVPVDFRWDAPGAHTVMVPVAWVEASA